MIERINIKGFRGIQEGQINDFRRVNLFVGQNNSGKSTLLEALYLTATAGRPAGLIVQHGTAPTPYETYLSVNDLLGDHPLRRVCARHSYPERQPDFGVWSQGIIRVRVADPDAPLAEFDLEAGRRDFHEGDEQTIALLTLDTATLQPTEQIAFAADITDQSPAGRVVFCWHPDLSYYRQGSAHWFVTGQLPVAHHTLFCDMSTFQRHLPTAVYQQMLATIPGWTQHLTDHFGKVFDRDSAQFSVHFVPVAPFERSVQGWIAPVDRPAMPIDAFGDGARIAFKLLAPLVALAERATPTEPGLLLWEEPELFQNPATLSRLLTEVVRIIKDRPVQLFLATHSLEVVALVTRLLQNDDLSHNDVLLFRTQLRDGKLTSSWFDAENLIAWLESGLDPRIWGDFVSPLQFRLREDGQ